MEPNGHIESGRGREEQKASHQFDQSKCTLCAMPAGADKWAYVVCPNPLALADLLRGAGRTTCGRVFHKACLGNANGVPKNNVPVSALWKCPFCEAFPRGHTYKEDKTTFTGAEIQILTACADRIAHDRDPQWHSVLSSIPAAPHLIYAKVMSILDAQGESPEPTSHTSAADNQSSAVRDEDDAEEAEGAEEAEDAEEAEEAEEAHEEDDDKEEENEEDAEVDEEYNPHGARNPAHTKSDRCCACYSTDEVIACTTCVRRWDQNCVDEPSDVATWRCPACVAFDQAKPKDKARIGLSKLRCNWTPAETATLKESIGRKIPKKIDYEFALLHLPGRSPSGIYRRCLIQNLLGSKPKVERQHSRRSAAAYANSMALASNSSIIDVEDDYAGDDVAKMLKLWGDGMHISKLSSTLGLAQNSIYRKLRKLRETKDLHLKSLYLEAAERRGPDRKRVRADQDEDIDAPASKRTRIDSSDPNPSADEVEKLTKLIEFLESNM